MSSAKPRGELSDAWKSMEESEVAPEMRLGTPGLIWDWVERRCQAGSKPNGAMCSTHSIVTSHDKREGCETALNLAWKRCSSHNEARCLTSVEAVRLGMTSIREACKEGERSEKGSKVH